MTSRPQAVAMAYLIAAVASVGMWWGIARGTGHLEAWDSSLYFVFGLPALGFVVLLLGYQVPQRAWRWAVTAGAGQVVAMFWLQPGSGPLFALGVTLHAATTLGLVLAALAGSALSRRLRHGRAG